MRPLEQKIKSLESTTSRLFQLQYQTPKRTGCFVYCKTFPEISLTPLMPGVHLPLVRLGVQDGEGAEGAPPHLTRDRGQGGPAPGRRRS